MKITSKNNKDPANLKYVFIESNEKLNKAFDILFDETLKKEAEKDQFNTLYEYYKIQYPKDLEIFKGVCTTDKYTKDSNNKLFFVQDLDDLKKNNHYLIKKKHFMYFLVIHTAFFMTVHKYFSDKYEDFKKMNNGIVFEYGLTDTLIYPWGILNRLDLSFDKELFSECLGWVISGMMINHHFCGIIPEDFMHKFIDDPDLNNFKTIYGKEWKEIVKEEWFQTTKCIYPKSR